MVAGKQHHFTEVHSIIVDPFTNKLNELQAQECKV